MASSRSPSPRRPRRSRARSASVHPELRGKEEEAMGLLSKSTDLTNRKDAPMERVEARAPVAPAVDVYENGDEVLLLAYVPGASTDGISVHLVQGQLTIRARRSDDTHGQALLGEFRATDYERAF